MNYITSCPKCDTQFLLSDAHIKAQRGKVQCGHCEHVFNAKNRLTAVSDIPENGADHQAETAEAALSDTNIESPHLPSADLPAMAETATAQAASPTPFHDTYTEYVAAPATQAPDDAASNPISHTFNDTQPFESTIKAISINDPSTDTHFAKSPAKKKRGLVLLCCLLLLLGLFQLIFFMRTPIAAYYPELKPLMTQLCAQAGCKIDLPRHLGLIVIGESDMQEHETYQSVIHFSTSIINHAPFVQAFPSIELTLTNADDKPVIRKIVAPKAYLLDDAEVAKGIAANEEVHIKLPIFVDQEVVTGYRVQLIY